MKNPQDYFLEQANKEFGTNHDYHHGIELEFIAKTMESYAEQQVNKLQQFKDYVHNRLDDMGIEKDPESEHKEHGCRIGGRLDLVENSLKKSQ